ncbi:MAG: SusD/RagB family nutrient-binding outer membrane lipoprotein [Saprospiraceae bacterium]|nr:SusD/RagB family nutrient-binding outer membrane lipoprotein [Saprospiraceae bacterium]
MLKNKIYTFALALIVLVGFSSCESYFEGINENPNDPTDVSQDVLLPGIEVNLGFTYGGDFSRYASILTQHAKGETRQWASINNYSSFLPVNFNTPWSFSMYAGVLNDLKILKEKSAEDGSNYYEGIASILEAYSWMLMVDFFNDVPFSEAFQGTDIIQPTYDDAASVYAGVSTLLAAGITKMSEEATGRTPGADDLMYGGDGASWVKFAHGLTARMHLHQKNYSSALTSIGSSFESAADEASVQFLAGSTTAAPWFQFNRDRGDIQVGDAMAALLSANADPRESLFTPTFDGSHPIFIDGRAVPLMSYAEAEFIRAECLLQTSADQGDVDAAFASAVAAGCEKYGVDATAASDYAAGLGSADLNAIMTQKYMSMYMEPEAFNDYRRHELPALTPNAGSAIPNRFPYPEEEILYNTNTPAVDIFTDKVFWDN